MGNYTNLSVTDRRRLYIFLDIGLTITEIAKRLDRHRSTLYRELERNRMENDYIPFEAHLKAKSRKEGGKSPFDDFRTLLFLIGYANPLVSKIRVSFLFYIFKIMS